MLKNPILKRLIGYVLNGLLIAVPVFVTLYIIRNVFFWLDSLIPGERKYPGLGILILVVVLALLGWLGTRIINDRLRRALDKLLDRLPLIKTIYKSITDLMGAFVGSKKRFNQPVLVKLNPTLEVEVIGFVTDEDLSELGNIDIQGKIAIYLPMSYSFSGHLVIVPIANVKKIDRNAVDVMKYIVSGGVVEIEHNVDESKA
jgi:uncharacterized membrane protein